MAPLALVANFPRNYMIFFTILMKIFSALLFMVFSVETLFILIFDAKIQFANSDENFKVHNILTEVPSNDGR